MRVQYVIVFVSDMERSVSFYRDVFGMKLRFESPAWSEFDTEGATLALHHGEGPAPAREHGAETAGRCRPGLRVSDLESFHARMLAQGVECVQEPTDSFGVRIAQYRDPDGLIVSVSAEGGAKAAR